jgi:uncharacterized metal-binding protein YceD (DUF177 family)
MNIDLTKLITTHVEEIEVSGEVNIPESLFEVTQIRALKDVNFTGSIVKLCDGDYQISGNLVGIMVLPDDITLESVEVNFASEIEENFSYFSKNEEKNLEIVKNRLDITEFLWQNILVEIPLKVVSEKNVGMTLKGDGWRLITEEELEKERSNNSPFSELSKMFDSREE